MIFLLLYQFAKSVYQREKQNEVIGYKILNEEIMSNINRINSHVNYYLERKLINVNGTTYFRPLKINLSDIPNKNIYFRSAQGTQYVYLSDVHTLNKKSISFESVFVNIDSTKLEVYNLSLIESPILCSKGLISIFTSYLTSDFLSISANYISLVNISEQFSVLENNINNEITSEPHAKIILQENAQYSLIKSVNSTSTKQQLTINEAKRDIQMVDIDNLTAIYFLNSSVEKLNVYNRYIIAVFPNSTLNLTSNSSNEIQIDTTSSDIEISLLESPSYRNHLILDLYLNETCKITFGPSFDLITNSFILGDIRIHHSKGMTAFSLTSVPYVTFIPLETVTFIPERHDSENYCLCLKSRYNECYENDECLLYHVNKSNYFFGTNSSFLTNIARSKAKIINIYVTRTISTNDYHIIILRQSASPGKVYNFISTDNDVQTFLSVQDTALDQSTPIDLSFTDITRVTLEAKTGVVTTLKLKNSPITLEKSFTVSNLETDLVSLSTQQTQSITITNVLTVLPHTTLSVIGVDLILAQNSRMEIKEISYFPYVTFASESVGFSDGGNDFNVRIQGAGPATIEIEDSSNESPSLIDIRSANSNIQLQLLVVFNLVNQLAVSFLNSLSLPENVEFQFKPLEDTMSTLFLIMPFDNEDSPGHRYNFGNITGNLSLILLTPETIYTFITSFARGDFIINNIPNLALNVMGIVDNVILYEDSVNISSIYGINLHLQKDFVYKQLTLLINNSKPFVLSLGDENMSKIFPICIESITSNTTIFFDDSFDQLCLNENKQKAQEMLKSIIIRHYTFNVTLKTNLEAVPMVVVDDDVVGVLYVANSTYFEIPNDEYESFRSGPELIVNVTDTDAIVYQNDFLAEKVTFYGEPFTFIAYSKSLVNYTFISTQPSINLSSSSILRSNDGSWFEAYALNFEKSPITGVNNIRVDYLNSDVFSLGRNTIQNLVVSSSSSIYDDTLKLIHIEKDVITLTSETNLEKSTASIKGDNWRIYYGGSDQVNVSIDSDSLSQQIELILVGNSSKTICFEKSWYRVQNAQRFVIVLEDQSAPIIVEADLMNMPDIVVVDINGHPIQYNEKLYKVVYTNLLSFAIFIALVFLIIIISIALMIIGFCRFKKKMANFEAKQTNKAMLNIPEPSNSNENEFIG